MARLCRTASFCCLFLLAGLSGPVAGAGAPIPAGTLLERADSALLAGRVPDAVALYDQLAATYPAQMPYLWQRGIALYLDGQFDACRRQFEAHRTVNPDDVENAAWHFACVARASSFSAARAGLLPVGPDRRVPMTDVYALLAGKATPEDVLDAGQGSAQGRFYAALYVAMFYDAQKDAVRARNALDIAVREEYARAGGYMHAVAKVYRRRMEP